MAQAFIFNNTAAVVSALVIGPATQANFLLGPNSVAPIILTPGLKALVSFAHGQLFAMRPIRSTAPNQVFAINPNNVNPGAGPVVYDLPDPDDVSVDGATQIGQQQESNLIQILDPGQ
jgi:hypothetical protein